jgi:putative nucleotidyltransferase with HDIG domain
MLKRIAVADVRLGMFVQELCGSWMEHPFWRTRFVLTDPRDIERLRQSSVRELWIDASQGLDIEGAASPVTTVAQAEREATQRLAPVARGPSAPTRVELREELSAARRIVADARPQIMSMFNEARLGNAVDVGRARDLVERIRGSIERSPAAVLSVARLKRADEYTFMHSVAVSGLMIALARQLGLSDAEVAEAGAAGLLHDLGKAKVPDAILNKPAALTDSEFATMRKHPEIGYQMLADDPQAGESVLDVVLHHHEKMDGSGYPRRLPAEQISRLARMGAICDVYDAITSNRPYKAGWDPAEAVRKMAEWAGGHFDPALFQAFVKTVGIYPVGSLVRMESGRIGVVVEQSGSSLLTPRVKVFFSLRKQLRIAPQVIDLAAPNAQDRIVAREDPAQWQFRDLETLWQPA